MLDQQSVLITVLSRFGTDPAALGRFLDATGHDIRNLRAALSDGTLAAGVLDYLADDEDLLVAVARDLRVSPDTLAAAVFRRRNASQTEAGEDF